MIDKKIVNELTPKINKEFSGYNNDFFDNIDFIFCNMNKEKKKKCLNHIKKMFKYLKKSNQNLSFKINKIDLMTLLIIGGNSNNIIDEFLKKLSKDFKENKIEYELLNLLKVNFKLYKKQNLGSIKDLIFTIKVIEMFNIERNIRLDNKKLFLNGLKKCFSVTIPEGNVVENTKILKKLYNEFNKE